MRVLRSLLCTAFGGMLAVHATAGFASPSHVHGHPPAAAAVVGSDGLPSPPLSASQGERVRARADALQHAHRFVEAAQVLDALLLASPTDARARLMRSQLRITLGNARGALADCAFAAPRLDALTATACSVQARAALGDRGDLRREVERAIAAASPGARSLAWAAGITADLAERDGDLAAAAQWHRRAVASADGAHYPAEAFAAFEKRQTARR
jgi:protein involved in temperature-dependent protein secretion